MSSTKQKYFKGKIINMINNINFLKQYSKKTKLLEIIEKDLIELQEFNDFLHRVIDQKESDIKYYQTFKTKYWDLKDDIREGNKQVVQRDQYGRDINKKFYFPFK